MGDKRIRDMAAAASVAATDKIYIDDGTLVDKYATAEQLKNYAFGTGADLTKTDDTNVTLTLGGTPTGAVLKATSITLGWTGTLAAVRLNANVVQAVTNDTNVTGSIATQNLTLGWTGTLAVARGGTGQATAAAAFNALKQAATDSATGVVELATDAEVTTGTDTARAITPRVLSSSNYGTAVVPILVFDDSEDVATGDGAGDIFWRVPSILNGWNLVGVAGCHQTAGTGTGTDTTSIQVHNVTQAADMLSTLLTIDEDETDSATAAVAAVIDTANDDVATGDQIRIDVDAVTPSSAPKGFLVELQFRLP